MSDPSYVRAEPPRHDDRHCIVCDRWLIESVYINSNGPYCTEHAPRQHCEDDRVFTVIMS